MDYQNKYAKFKSPESHALVVLAFNPNTHAAESEDLSEFEDSKFQNSQNSTQRNPVSKCQKKKKIQTKRVQQTGKSKQRGNMTTKVFYSIRKKANQGLLGVLRKWEMNVLRWYRCIWHTGYMYFVAASNSFCQLHIDQSYTNTYCKHMLFISYHLLSNKANQRRNRGFPKNPNGEMFHWIKTILYKVQKQCFSNFCIIKVLWYLEFC